MVDHYLITTLVIVQGILFLFYVAGLKIFWNIRLLFLAPIAVMTVVFLTFALSEPLSTLPQTIKFAFFLTTTLFLHLPLLLLIAAVHCFMIATKTGVKKFPYATAAIITFLGCLWSCLVMVGVSASGPKEPNSVESRL